MNLQNTKILNHKKNKGFGLVEIMIALIIVGSIITAVLWKSMSTMQASDDNKTTTMIFDAMTKINSTMSGNYANVNNEILKSVFPAAQHKDEGIAGPYKRSLITATGGNDNRYNLTITNVPKSSCVSLVSLWIKEEGISIKRDKIEAKRNSGAEADAVPEIKTDTIGTSCVTTNDLILTIEP